jgi:septal ring factor EnvC (AmiA/AmiB activator)
MGLGLKISAGLLLVILAMGGLGYWYYTDSQATISTLTKNNAKLEESLELSEAAVDSLEADVASAGRRMSTLNKEFAEVRSQKNDLARKLEKHELGVLAANKPGLVERVINNATAKAGRCFELLSGAELTEAEKNAATPRTANSECPWMFENKDK